MKELVQIFFLRHGKTAGNAKKRYIGRTDEALSDAGAAQIRRRRDGALLPPVEMVFASPMQRCLQTAKILFPVQTPVVIEDFREIDFGDYEGKSAAQLLSDPVLGPGYQAWIDSNGTMPFPHGEAREDFIRRSRRGFEQMLEILGQYERREQKEQPAYADSETPASSRVLSVAAVVHGGTIMAILSGVMGGDYFDYMCGNGEGYVLTLPWPGSRSQTAPADSILVDSLVALPATGEPSPKGSSPVDPSTADTSLVRFPSVDPSPDDLSAADSSSIGVSQDRTTPAERETPPEVKTDAG